MLSTSLSRPLVGRVLVGFLLFALAFYGAKRMTEDDPYTTKFLLPMRSAEHTSELQSLMRISYAVFCLKKKHHLLNLKKTPRPPHMFTSHYPLLYLLQKDVTK